MTENTSETFAIASDYVEAIAALDPFEATEMGVPGHDGEVTDFSPEALARRVALTRDTLTRLETVHSTGPDDELAAAVMRDALPRSAAGLRARFEEGMRLGKLSARRQVEEAIRQLGRFAGKNTEIPPA